MQAATWFFTGNIWQQFSFQSPQPMQAATERGRAPRLSAHISIPAAYAGCDTRWTAAFSWLRPYFNPRSLCRLRQLNIVALPNLLLHVANAPLTLSLHRFRELGKHRSFWCEPSSWQMVAFSSHSNVHPQSKRKPSASYDSLQPMCSIFEW